MSNHHVRPKRSPSHKDPFLATLLVARILAILTIPFYERFLSRRFDPTWPSVSGRVEETRIVIVGTRDHAYRPGEIDYRAEVRVVYGLNGISHDEWLPASNIVSDRAYLEFWLSERRSKLCIVHWNPRIPSDIEAVLS